MSLRTIYTKEYGAELAGNRVGWASVEKLADPDLVAVDVAVATVGSQGARHGYRQIEGANERLYSPSSSKGFLAVAALSVLVSNKEDIDLRISHSFRADRDGGQDVSDILLQGASGYRNPESNDTRIWADSSDELLGLLKDGLAKNDVADQYPTIYYYLNGMQGRDSFRPLSGLARSDSDKIFLPDSAMIQTTEQQVAASNDVVTYLQKARSEDELMRQRLTVFSDISAAQVPDVFVESRRKVSDYEKAARAVLLGTYVAPLIHLPIGCSGGRSWPYMDPDARHEQQAFGAELRSLQSGKTSRATYELNREIDELEYRLAYTRRGREVLRSLSVSEQHVA